MKLDKQNLRLLYSLYVMTVGASESRRYHYSQYDFNIYIYIQNI